MRVSLLALFAFSSAAHAVAESCDLCDRRFVFVIATGRSGSTSVLETINSLPGVHLRGENGASLLGAMDLYKRSLWPEAEGPARGLELADQVSDEHLLQDPRVALCEAAAE